MLKSEKYFMLDSYENLRGASDRVVTGSRVTLRPGASKIVYKFVLTVLSVLAIEIISA